MRESRSTGGNVKGEMDSMVLAFITDYERAVLDYLREDWLSRNAIGNLSEGELPTTQEHWEYLEKSKPEWAASRKEKENQAIRCFKAQGYTGPYEYGKGKVKVKLRTI